LREKLKLIFFFGGDGHVQQQTSLHRSYTYQLHVLMHYSSSQLPASHGLQKGYLKVKVVVVIHWGFGHLALLGGRNKCSQCHVTLALQEMEVGEEAKKKKKKRW
jgi:hypothetical protein